MGRNPGPFLPRSDIDALFHLVYNGPGADTSWTLDDPLLSASQQFEIRLEAHWLGINERTRNNHYSQLRHWLAYVQLQQENDESYTGIVHNHCKMYKYMEYRLTELIQSGSQDPYGAIDNTRKALAVLRKCQRGIPNPSDFSLHSMIIAVMIKARQATIAARTGPDRDPMAGGFCSATLSKSEITKIIDTSLTFIQKPFVGVRVGFMISSGIAAGFRGDDLCDLKYSLIGMPPQVEAAPVPMQIVTLALNGGKTNTEGQREYSGFAQHLEPHLDAQGHLATNLLWDIHMNKLDIINMIELGDKQWWRFRLLFKTSATATSKTKYDHIYEMMNTILDEIDIFKTKKLHLFRDTGVILLSSFGANIDVMKIWGRWERSAMSLAYVSKNPLAALQAYGTLAGFGVDFMSRHFLGRALVHVPPHWIEMLFPNIDRALTAVNERMCLRKKNKDSNVPVDYSAQCFLSTLKYQLGPAFLRNLPLLHERYSNLYVALQLPVVHAILSDPLYPTFAKEVKHSHSQYLSLFTSEFVGAKSVSMMVSSLCGNMMDKIVHKLDDLHRLAAKPQCSSSSPGNLGNLDQQPCETRTPLFSSSVQTVHEAWQEWTVGFPGFPESAILCRLAKRDEDPVTYALGNENRKSLSKNRHLYDAIHSLIEQDYSEQAVISLFEAIRHTLRRSPNQPMTIAALREGMRLVGGMAAMLAGTKNGPKLSLKNNTIHSSGGITVTSLLLELDKQKVLFPIYKFNLDQFLSLLPNDKYT